MLRRGSKLRRSVVWVHLAEEDVDKSQWNAVALWAWDIVVDNCAICRNHIMDLCESPGRVEVIARHLMSL